MPPSTVFSYWRRDHRRAGVAPGQPQHQQQPQQVQQKQQPTSLPSKAGSTDNPPQLPLLPSTPDLTTSFGESPVLSDSGGALGPEENNPQSWDQQHLHWDQNQTQTQTQTQSRDQDQEQSPSPSQNLNQADKLTAGVGSISSRAPTSSSATNLTVPSSSFEKQARPHSSPEEREKPSPALTSQSNYSQSSFAAPRPDLSEGDSASSKQNSPFRLSFGKGITPSSEGQKPISTTATATGNPQSAASPSAPSKANNSKSSPDVSPAEKPTIPPKDSKFDRSSSRRYVDRDGSSDHAHHKSGKAMLHLLNPMSLLARRRSSRIAGSRADDVKIGAPNLVPAIPDDYDPRIRGNIVHDFSAPRPRRNLSAAPVPQDATGQTGSNDAPQNATPTDPASQASEQQKTWHNEHPPAFKEHFEDDRKALQVENKGYLQSPLMMNPPTTDGENTLPVFARKLPSKVPENEKEQLEKEQQQQQQQQQEQQEQEKKQQQQMEHEQEQEQEQQKEKQKNQSLLEQGQEQPIANPETPPYSPEKDESPPIQNEEDTVVKMPQPPSGLPRHLKSNASRFSFDMTDMESSVQEKLLEEKHKEKEAERKAKYGPDDYSEDDDYDDLLDDMDDGLEEKIPGVNTDADEDDMEGFSGPGKVMSKSWFSPGLSPIIGSPASPIVPHMANMPVVPGAPVPNGLAQHPPFDASYFPPMNETAVPTDNTSAPQGIDAGEQQQPATTAPKPVGVNPGTSQQKQKQQADDDDDDDDDDLYFDDGEFGDLSADTGGDAERFDESIFDDETSHLYERKKKQPAEPVVPAAHVDNKEQPEPKISSSSLSDVEALGTTRQLSSHRVDLGHAPSVASEHRGAALKNYNSVSEGARDPRSAKAHGGVLSEHNLEALHNALTNAAVGSDRFEGNESISDQSLDQESVARTAQTTDSHPGLISDNSRLSQGMDVFGSEEVYEDFDYDDADDSLYDDPIIAAANAEALENDDEGFYGEEFGFYAHSPGNNGAHFTNGGYFGAHGVEGISRSFSSRGKFREPSLTPITERSERSTRNSLISLTAQHGHAPHSSPGLAQLVDLGSNLDEEMSLSALMKLRRGAWGGSNSSLRSSSASPPPVPHPHSASNRASFTALSDASPTVPTIPADLIWPGSAAGSPVREAERNGSSTASPV